jgi:hypothetical protein
MRLRIPRSVLSMALIVAVAGCITPYDPPLTDAEINFLVIDGFLNSGNKSAQVKLSMAVPLHVTSTVNPVSSAIVRIEGADGSSFPLPETNVEGVYSANSLNVSNGKEYRLRVITGGKTYLSDLVEMKASPVLDSVTWRTKPEGVTIYVDSHDVSGSTKYYQWTFTETWEYNADKFSQFIWQNGAMIGRRPQDYIYICYDSAASTKVLISTTTDNTADVVNDFPLAFIPKGS